MDGVTRQAASDFLREIRLRAATKIKCPSDVCGFRFTILDFKITSIKITKIEVGTAPALVRPIITRLGVDTIKDYIDSELKGKKAYSFDNCSPGCTPDKTKTETYAGHRSLLWTRFPYTRQRPTGMFLSPAVSN